MQTTGGPMQENKNQQEKDISTTKPTDAVKSTQTATNANEFEPNEQTTEKKNFEGDEREWQAPDVKPKYPTDVQAKADSESDLQANNRPSRQENMEDYESLSDEDDNLESENPDLMIRH